MPRRLPIAALAAAALAFLAAPIARADDSVDLQLAGSASVKGTIRSAGERESFILELPEGATVKAVAKRRGKGAFVPYLDFVLAPASDPVASAVVSTKRGVTTLTSGVLTQSGTYRLRIFGDGVIDGDYQLKVTVKLQSKWTGRGDSSAGAFSLATEFGAPAGAQAQVTLKAAKKSSQFVPALDAMIGPEGFSVPLSGTRTGWVRLGSAGTYTVGFHDGGVVGGEWTCGVVLRLPRVRKSNVDISAGHLTGNFVDDQPVFGRLVGGDEDALVDPPDGLGALDGASVSIPGGALPFPVVITMAEGDDFELPGGAHPAGPVIQFGPPGTNFNGLNATITLPYDGTAFGDPQNELTVYVRNEKTGDVEPVLPRSSYDFSVPGVVSFPALHFSSYVSGGAVSRSVEGDWVLVDVTAQPQPDFGGKASIVVGNVQFVGTSYYLDGIGIESQWSAGAIDGGQPFATSTVQLDTDYGQFQTFPDESLALTSFGGQQGSQVRLVRGTSGDVLFREPTESDHAESVLLLRRTRGQPTPTTLAGKWHLFFYSLGARDDGGGAPDLKLRAEAGRATVSFALDGTIEFSSPSGREAQTDFPAGTWSAHSAGVPRAGTFSIDGDVYVEIPDPSEPPAATKVRLRPCLDGDALVGATTEGEAMLLFLIRESKGQSASAFAGSTSAFGFDAVAIDRPAAGLAQGFEFTENAVTIKQGANRRLTIDTLSEAIFTHDATGFPSVSFPPSVPSDTTTLSVSANGAIKTTDGLIGAITANRDLFFAVQTDGSTFELDFGTPGSKLPGRTKR